MFNNVELNMAIGCWKLILITRGRSRILSRSRFSKKFSKNLTFFLVQPNLNLFSELSQITKKTLFLSNFLHRRQNFEKKGQFLENFD